MELRKILCVSPDRHPEAVADSLRARNWELISATDLATARRIQTRHGIGTQLAIAIKAQIAIAPQKFRQNAAPARLIFP